MSTRGGNHSAVRTSITPSNNRLRANHDAERCTPVKQLSGDRRVQTTTARRPFSASGSLFLTSLHVLSLPHGHAAFVHSPRDGHLGRPHLLVTVRDVATGAGGKHLRAPALLSLEFRGLSGPAGG